MTTNIKTKINPIQAIKQVVMLNSLLILTIIFLAFFNGDKFLADESAVTVSQAVTATAISPVSVDNGLPNPTATASQQRDKLQSNELKSNELQGLPYISRDGLERQAAVQVVNYQQQPRVQARSSR